MVTLLLSYVIQAEKKKTFTEKNWGNHIRIYLVAERQDLSDFK